MKVINLISGPRNISTAMMYSFAQRGDVTVMDEPFYSYYLRNATLEIEHPAHEKIVTSMEADEMKVVNGINAMARSKILFLKGMAHHFLSESPKYLLDWDNVLLIRHPRKLIASFAKVITNPSLRDIGIKRASELFLYLKEQGKIPLVLDSDELMLDPENYLRKLCDGLGLEYMDSMMQWEKGGIPEDGIWAEHWYKNVHNTTGFEVQQSRTAEVPPHLGPLLAEAMPYYETLSKEILIND